MEDRKQIALEPTIAVAGVSLTPIAVTIVREFPQPGAPVIIVREALGAIVCDAREVRVFMVDGRELTVAELVSEYPGLSVQEPRLFETFPLA